MDGTLSLAMLLLAILFAARKIFAMMLASKKFRMLEELKESIASIKSGYHKYIKKDVPGECSQTEPASNYCTSDEAAGQEEKTSGTTE